MDRHQRVPRGRDGDSVQSPVLTLHTRHLNDDDTLLSTFLHEQLHWWVPEWEEALDRALTAMRELFPEVPPSEEGGARDERSTYLHLVVCDLELQVTTKLLGAGPAGVPVRPSHRS